MIRQSVSVAIACLALAGCGSERHLEDLKQFVKDSDKMPRTAIPPLPEVQTYTPVEYAAFDLTDPFVPRKPQTAQPPKRNANDPRLDPNRRKGPLEAFALENLKMVGTLQQKKDFFALIKTPDNNLYRIKAGDFLGQNFGRVSEINEASVKLMELIQDSGNEWREEERTLLLQE